VSTEVNAVLDRVEQLMSELQALRDQMAHELKGGAVRILRRLKAVGESGIGDDIHAERLKVCEAEAREMLSNVDTILELSQIRDGVAAHDALLDLAVIVQDKLDKLAITAEDRDQHVEADLQPAPVMGDARLLTLLFDNLFGNAVKYTPRGGTISIKVRGGAEGAKLSVADTGPGIPAEEREAVFKLRHRLKRDRDKPGYGYGLSFCAAITKRHGGVIAIEPSEGGAVFMATFPPVDRNSG
jgi:signal transduction histidine kinase